MRTGVAYNLVGAAFNQGSTLLVNLAVANLLGREIFGRYTMLLVTVGSLAALGQLSMGYTATKYVAEFRVIEPAKASRILGLCAIVSGAAGLIAACALAVLAPWLAGPILGASELAPELRIIAAAVFFTVANGFMTGALAGLESYRTLARAGVASGTIYALLCTVSAWAYGLTGAVAGVTVSALAQCVILAAMLLRESARQGVPLTCRGLSQERAVLLHFALPTSLGALVSQPALWVASALLARQMGGYQQLALFGAANTFRAMVLFVPQAINNVGMSLLNNQRRSSAQGYRDVFWMNAALTALVAVGTAGVLFLAGGPLLRMFGPDFADGRLVLGLMLGAAVVEAMAVAAYQIVVSRGRIWPSLMLVTAPRDVTLVVLAAMLTPSFGAAGLATAYGAAWILALLGIVVLVVGPRLAESRAASAWIR